MNLETKTNEGFIEDKNELSLLNKFLCTALVAEYVALTTWFGYEIFKSFILPYSN